MTTLVTNQYNFQVAVGLDTAAGINADAVHIMPFATVKLPLGASVTQNSKVQFPRLLIIDENGSAA